MDIEAYSYSIFTAVIGMTVVFLFLWFLSFLMVSLKVLFKEKKTVSGAEIVREEERIAVKDEKKAEWIVAAVSAYITEEEEELYPRSAEGWQPVTNEKYDPWVIRGKLLQKWSGV
ncbi:MAG: hypothetical protein GXP33_02695 [Spirochaetes bacterium]|nr:hypothetical protein [Spirochaetota bacterium]